MANGLTLISLNVRGVRESIKRKRILEWCKVKGGDIIFLQETYSTPDVETRWRSELEGSLIYFSHGTSHSRGVLVSIASKLNINICDFKIDRDGRFIIIKGEIRGAKILFGNFYFPTRDKENEQLDFLENMEKSISDLWTPEYTLVLGGDFNLIMNKNLDYMGLNTPAKTKFNDNFEDFLIRYDLEDIWRKKYPNDKQFTFKRKHPVVQTRLDYWFITRNLEKLVDSCNILSSITPDHSGIRLQFKNLVDTFEYGKSYWKFNNSLCEDKVFVDEMMDKIRELKEQLTLEIVDKLLLWDFMKMKMREFVIRFSKEKAKFRRLEIERLEKDIELLENELLLTQSSKVFDEIEEKKSALGKMYDYVRQGIRVRSRAEWVEEGENNTQYFEQLLKFNKRKTVIKELYDDENKIVNDKNKILKIIKDFYENLYFEQKRNIDDNSPFFNNIQCLSEESKNVCEGKLTKEECYKTLKDMKFNKSPGNDGFTVEFYHTFWPVLGDMIVGVLNEAYNKGHLSNSQKQGVITLLEKEGKDAMYIKNYRPITLLNVDYKILSKVLASRIKKVLGKIVHYDQVGYIKDRNIGEAVRLVDDMFFDSMSANNGYAVAADFEKAFDSVDHNFLFKVLDLFGFGISFCSWVKTLYAGMSSSVMNGGRSTGYFNINRGVRQGDPLSPYLFLLVIEILANKLRNDKNIEGFKFGEREIKQVLYADDLTVFVKNENSIKRLKYIFEEFDKISGLKINKGKTNFVWMGKEEDKPDILLFGKLVKEVKILGVYFTLDIKIKEEMNYKEILSKIKRLLGWWKQRDLSIMGKIHLLKTYALSKLNYVTSLLAVPKWVLSDVEKITFEFLWNGKDRIKRNIMCQDYKNGGMRMSNYKLSVKAQRIGWLSRLLYGEKNMGWKVYFDYCCRLLGGRFIFLCDYEVSKMNLKIPPFYLEVLQAWEDIRECRNMEGDLTNPIIFNNRNICIKGKMIFDINLFDKDIYLVSHIWDKGRIKPVEYFVSLGLKTNELLKIMDICRILPDELKEDRALDKFQLVDMESFDLELKVLGKKIKLKDIHSRNLYEFFVKDLQNSYSMQIKDGQNNLDYNEKEIKEIFIRPRHTTLLNKLREFQYKLLHGVIYTKVQLIKFGFVEDNVCSFCKTEVETYTHVFLDCDIVKALWKEVITNYDLMEIRNMDWKDIFVGLSGTSIRIKFINSLIIMLKHIIYKSRNKGTLPPVNIIHKKMLEYIDEEKKLATRRGKLGAHLLKWEYFNVR